MTYREAFAITPHDTDNLAKNAQALYVGTAGHVSVVMVRDDLDPAPTVVTFNAVPAGTILPISVQRVRATGTTATLLIGLRS